jgi:hypothetical protein
LSFLNRESLKVGVIKTIALLDGTVKGFGNLDVELSVEAVIKS